MLFGTFIQTIVLIVITYKTDWDKQVCVLHFSPCLCYIEQLLSLNLSKLVIVLVYVIPGIYCSTTGEEVYCGSWKIKYRSPKSLTKLMFECPGHPFLQLAMSWVFCHVEWIHFAYLPCLADLYHVFFSLYDPFTKFVDSYELFLPFLPLIIVQFIILISQIKNSHCTF